jgi:hypothetical protein
MHLYYTQSYPCAGSSTGQELPDVGASISCLFVSVDKPVLPSSSEMGFLAEAFLGRVVLGSSGGRSVSGMLLTSVVFFDLRRRWRRKNATRVIVASPNKVQPTLIPAATLLDSECEFRDVDDADGLCDVDVDEALLELVEMCVTAELDV